MNEYVHNANVWALYIATSIDLAGNSVVGESIDGAKLPLFATGGGITRAIDAKLVDMPELGERSQVAVMKNSPNALAVARRCAAYGFDFHWRGIMG